MQTIYFEEKDAAKPTRYTSPSFFKPNATNRMGKDIRGMKGVSPLVTQKFYNQASDDLLSKYFPDREHIQKGNSNLILDAVDETKNGYVFQRSDFFSDKNRDGKINADEELAFKLLLFVSTDGNKVKECYEVVKPADDEIILFLETDSDSLSGQKLFGRISQKIRKTYVDTSTGKLYSTFFDGDIIETVQKYLSTASKPIIEELLVTGYIADKSITADFFSGLRYLLMALSAPGKALGWVVNKLGEEFDSLKIPDEFWDTENENYSFKKENIIENLSIPPDQLAILKNLFTDKSGFNLADITPKMLDDIILNQIAVIESFVGKYNSYVKTEIEDIFKTVELPEMEKATDDIAQAIALICGVWNGLVDFVSSALKFIGSLLEAPFDISKDVQHTLEMIDNFWDILRDGVLWKNLKNAINVGMKEMAAYLKDKPTGDINWVRVYYVGGFTISFAATFFIPVANAAKISNLGKVGEILAEIQNSLFQTAKFVKLQTAEAYQKAIRALQELLEMFAKGGPQLKNFVDDVLKKLVDWFLKNKKSVEGWANKIKQYLSKDEKTEEFFRKIDKKFNPVGEEILSANKLKNLRRLLKETFDVTIQFVDQNPALRAKLKDWTARRVAGSFNMVEGVMYLRKSVTAYTAQHEMYHLKLWYKMTKEFPELRPLFEKTLGFENRLFHEEYVLAQFMKNPSKWKEADLLNDLAEINRLRELKDLNKVDLEYFKNWNLEQELLKFN
ncbi:zincin-like metallopeptidase toxin domain-containing protein [Chryseobacterium sp.]|uniref:zincin-like metallopeptidase toxin domain-containing protein n=1 Tax=Chryseobacterium sp. TaxID=1871047 RepID=UPI001624509C|nr:zincin-like metallopeptidase toxin domain-containing protein [Chryseobacterium sp.]